MPRSKPRPPILPPSSSSRSGEGKVIADCRLALGMSTAQFAKLFATDQRTVTRWEANASHPPASLWMALYAILEGTKVAARIPAPKPFVALLAERRAVAEEARSD